MSRPRPDACPGLTRPWVAEDGGLLRLRLIGGHVRLGALRALVDLAERHGSGVVHLTRRANLQLRALPLSAGEFPDEVVDAVLATGLIRSMTHDLVRNVLVSPTTGLATAHPTRDDAPSTRADLRPVAAALDDALCAEPRFSALPATFRFVLDDGSGDVLDAPADLAAVALDAHTLQIRWGEHRWLQPVPRTEAAAALVALTHAFLDHRADAAWHADEVRAAALPLPDAERDPRVPAPHPVTHAALGRGADHQEVPLAGGVLDAAALARLTTLATRGPGGDADAVEVVITPYHSVLVPTPTDFRPPTRRYDYEGDGAAIYRESFATIRAEADVSHVPADAEKVVVRMVHGTGQVDLAPDVVVHPRLVGAARAALADGAPIITDAHMVASGVTRARLPRDNEVLCALRDPRVPDLARAWGTTRSAAALSLLADRIGGAVVAIGNAPTALFHLLELLADGAPPPAAIVGCPVGFIGAAESKQALAAYAEEHDLPYLTVHGRRGGSAMTASALNAIAQERE